MDKLCCDICGGALTMQPSGKTAVCDSCGMQYSAERIREKVQEIKGTVSVEGTVRTQEADFIIRGGVLERYNGNEPHVIIPDSVVRIGDSAFAECLGIKSVALCPGVIEIGQSAFSGCKFLEKIEFSDALEVIGGYAFRECRFLKKVTLPETVKYIGWSAFLDCTSLETINIPNHLEGAEPKTTVARRLWGTFVHCPALQEVIISEEQKEKLFIYRYLDDDISLQPAQAIFERESTDGDDSTVYYEENCGPWYLSFKSEQLKKIQIRKERKRRNECLHCGGHFTGLFTPKCAKCGKPKDY